MIIIVGKELHNCVICGETISYWNNGYPTFDGITAYPTEVFDIFEVDNIPSDDITEYCYTESEGFTPFVPPELEPTNGYGISDELFNQIKSDYREKIAQEVSENGYNA